MKLDRPKTTPNIYINFADNAQSKSKLVDQYAVKPQSAETPWIPSRMGQAELLRAVANKRLTRNKLNFVSEDPNAEPYVQFPGLGRFSPDFEYDPFLGRPKTPNFPEQQPDFNPFWNELYNLSPIIDPKDKTKNPFPRQDNMDPFGYLRAMVQQGGTPVIPELPAAVDETVQSGTQIS
jgi:hypothetical protein